MNDDASGWVDLLAGADLWHTAAVGDVPVIRMSDGPAGVRGTDWAGPASASFPCGAALGATFDVDLVRQVGEALGREARSKNVHMVLAPTVNLQRTPIGGRNFECFSEDPIHTAAIAVAYIDGVQSRGVACCVKHLVCNDTELARFEVSAEVSETVLREVYLVPFEAAVAAGVQAVMTAYNRLNGTFCSEHHWLIDDVLRGEWGFRGVVVSDWYGTRSGAAALLAGLDLEMPGPSRHRGEALAASLDDSAELRAAVMRSAARIGELARWTGAAETGTDQRTDDDPATRAVIRRAGAAGAVLLVNRTVATAPALPIRPGTSVALIGPYADQGRVQGGGSARVTPANPSGALEALRERGYAVEHRPGCRIPRYLPVMSGAFEVEFSDEHGSRLHRDMRRLRFVREAFQDDGLHGMVAAHLTGTVRVASAGRWRISMRAVGAATLRIDGEIVVALDGSDRGGSFFGFGSDEVIAVVDLAADVDHRIELDYPMAPSPGLRGVIVGLAEEIVTDLIPAAVAAAADAEVAVVVVGTDDEWETEGEDRTTLALPGAQDRLIEAVAAVNERVVVVVNAGSPVAMPWLDSVAAVLQLWFPGGELGHVLADVLSGDVEPSGRLPITVPRRLAQTPAGEHRGDGVVAEYREGRSVGYRWYHRHREDPEFEPLFWFGYGLGYTTFAWGQATLAGDRETAAVVSVEVTNTGRRPGHEVVQVYLDSDVGVRFAASRKVAVMPGDRQVVRIEIPRRAWMVWGDRGWEFAPGRHEVLIGAHAGALSRVAVIDG